MAIQQILENRYAELRIDLDCHIEWRFAPETQEEQMHRDQMDITLRKIAYDLQQSVGHTILAVVKIKGDL